MTSVHYHCMQRAGLAALSPDAWSNWSRGQSDAAEHNQLVLDATRHLLSIVIPAFAASVDEACRSHAVDTVTRLLGVEPVSEEVHRQGMNVRHLGYLRSLLKYPQLSGMCPYVPAVCVCVSEHT